jgi:hypothetical protein
MTPRRLSIDPKAPHGVTRFQSKGKCAAVAASLRRAIAPAMDEQAKQRANAERASSKSTAGQ